MGELAIISFAARFVRVREECTLGKVRVLSFVPAVALASLGKVEAKICGRAFPFPFRG